MQSTISLFRHLHKNLPPLFPPDIEKRISMIIRDLEKESRSTLEEIEDKMIAFGTEVWPWMQAFMEFLRVTEKKMGEHFFIPHLSDELIEKYEAFKKIGYTLSELYVGRAIHFFSPEERQKIAEACVEMKQDAIRYTKQEILSTSKKEYLARVEKYKKELEPVKKSLHRLQQLAYQEKEHEHLMKEIRARIRSIEESLVMLGQELQHHHVHHSPEFFEERKLHLERLKGIHVPQFFDFYKD
jgi:hypothetical protein